MARGRGDRHMQRQFGKPHGTQVMCLKALDTCDKFMHSEFLVCLRKVQYTHMLMMHLKRSFINMNLSLVRGMQIFNGVRMLLL